MPPSPAGRLALDTSASGHAIRPGERLTRRGSHDDQYFFVDNPLNKYTVSPRNNLKTNADGSLDLYLQHESPGKGDEPNWLPAPPGPFIVMMRLYWPSETPPSILDGSWKPPPLTARAAPRVGRRPGPQ